MDQVTTLIDRVESALKAANDNQTKLTEQQFSGLAGLSGRKIRILLNELLKEDTRYLEVGTFTGSTFVSAMYGNKPASSTVIDSFSASDSWEMDMKVDVSYHGIQVKNGLFLHFLENCKRNNINNFTCIQGLRLAVPDQVRHRFRFALPRFDVEPCLGETPADVLHGRSCGTRRRCCDQIRPRQPRWRA